MNSEMPGDAKLDFEVLDRRNLGGRFRPLERIRLRHASLTGGEPLDVTREVLRSGTAAVILPYDPQADRLVVIRQFRVGAALSVGMAAALELPAGLLDGDEEAVEAARRELREETGLEAQGLAEIFQVLSSPGLCDERVVVFLALVDSTRLAATAGLAEEHEDIVPLAVAADTLIESADRGRIRNAFLFASLQWFARKGRAEAARLAGNGREIVSER